MRNDIFVVINIISTSWKGGEERCLTTIHAAMVMRCKKKIRTVQEQTLEGEKHHEKLLDHLTMRA